MQVINRNIKVLISLISMFVLLYHVEAQVPTTGDCLGAIPVCQDSYFQPNTANGEGNYPNEIRGISYVPIIAYGVNVIVRGIGLLFKLLVC